MLVDKNDKTVLKVERISDNCYEILSQGKSKVCNSTIIIDANLLHKHAGQINYKKHTELSTNPFVQDIPKLIKVENFVRAPVN